MTPTLVSILKSMQPGGEYAVFGALTLVALAAAYWYGVKGLGKVVDAVDRRNLSGIYVLPLLAILGYITCAVVTVPVQPNDVDVVGGLLLALALFQAFAVMHLFEVYPAVTLGIWAVMRLGLPSSVMGSFWLSAYLATLAFLKPSTVGALAAMASVGVFFSIAVFRAGATWLSGVNGSRPLAFFAGHLLLTLSCAALAGVYPYSSAVLTALAEVYCTGMVTLGGTLLYLDRFEERVPVLPAVNTPFGPCIAVSVGVLMACLGFTLSAWILIPVGVLGLVNEYTDRRSEPA